MVWGELRDQGWLLPFRSLRSFFRETHLRIKVNDYRHSGLLGVLLEEGVKLGSVADCANGWPSVDAEEENEKED